MKITQAFYLLFSFPGDSKWVFSRFAFYLVHVIRFLSTSNNFSFTTEIDLITFSVFYVVDVEDGSWLYLLKVCGSKSKKRLKIFKREKKLFIFDPNSLNSIQCYFIYKTANCLKR